LNIVKFLDEPTAFVKEKLHIGHIEHTKSSNYRDEIMWGGNKYPPLKNRDIYSHQNFVSYCGTYPNVAFSAVTTFVHT
jgi:hypothetical protein